MFVYVHVVVVLPIVKQCLGYYLKQLKNLYVSFLNVFFHVFQFPIYFLINAMLHAMYCHLSQIHAYLVLTNVQSFLPYFLVNLLNHLFSNKTNHTHTSKQNKSHTHKTKTITHIYTYIKTKTEKKQKKNAKKKNKKK